MAKTCGECEKSVQIGSTFNAEKTVVHCRCSITGKMHSDDHQCDVPEKPRLCEVLGVDVGEWFKVRDDVHEKILGPFFVRGDGYLVCSSAVHALDAGYALIEAINHPEKIKRLPRLTPEAFGAILFSGQPRMGQDGLVLEKETYIGAVRADLFPSVGLGDLIQVEDEPSEGAAGQ